MLARIVLERELRATCRRLRIHTQRPHSCRQMLDALGACRVVDKHTRKGVSCFLNYAHEAAHGIDPCEGKILWFIEGVEDLIKDLNSRKEPQTL